MGAGGLNSAVADAGPLIHLNEIGGLSLLGIFEALHIPDAVWQETVGPGHVAEADLRNLGIAQRHTLIQTDVTQFVQDNGLKALHVGERESLCLCHRAAVSILLTDDLAVREASRRLSIAPVGSLGIVVRAYRLSRLSLAEAEACLQDLHDGSSLFVTPAIVDLAIQQLRTHQAGP